MKWLKKLKLVNWHYFKDEEIQFGKQTMITGSNAAGKSTIIDALQVLFIADGRMIRFNSSAHDDAKRSILSYLRGKIGSDDKLYLREEDFTTYLMAEFFDEVKKEYFVVLTVVDVYRDDAIDQEFFIVNRCRIQDLEYMHENGHLKNRDEFHRYIDRLENRNSSERTKEGYQKALLHRMGQVDQRFFPTFSKALSFKPIQDVRDFVYDYILDEKELQLDVMKENFEVHQQYKKELEDLVVRQDALEKIKGLHEQYIKYGETAEQQEYVIRQLEHLVQQEEYNDAQQSLQSLADNLKKQKEENALNDLALVEGDAARREAYQALDSNAAKKRLEVLLKVITENQKSLNEQRAELASLIETLKGESKKVGNLRSLQENIHLKWDDLTLHKLDEGMKNLMVGVQSLESGEVPKVDLTKVGEELADLHNRFIIAGSEASKKITELENEKGVLEKEIRDLENKKRPYPESVKKLKRVLEEQLYGKSAVWIFCEEMEVQNEQWRNAIEGYLSTQRFDLLVEPAYFEEALQIYEKEKWKLGIEGAGLVNSEKERMYLGTMKPNTLAGEVHSENPVIQARIEHLMGRVVKVDSEKELSRHQAAVTATCMLYQNLVARQMKEERYRIPYVGLKAIPRQLELKKLQVQEVEGLLSEHWQSESLFKQWQELLKDSRAVYKEINEKFNLPQSISDIESQLKNHQIELGQLDAEGIKKLEENCNFWELRIKELDKKKTNFNRSIAVQESQHESLEKELIHREQLLVQAVTKINDWVDLNSPDMHVEAERRWRDAAKQQKPTVEKMENWRRSQSGNRSLANGEFKQLENHRHDFNVKYQFNGQRDATNNEEYQHLFDQINIDIGDYQVKLEEALRQSEEEFASHFVYKMKEAIETAKRQFFLLNKSLKQFPFNEESYQFEVKASDKYKRFYNVIMNLSTIEKASLFDLPDEEQNQALHELFEMLTKGEEDEQQEFTDYRRYLDFDLIITSPAGSKIRFSTVLKEKSGGETQTPFYIAILSSFNQLYQSLKTMRLVVFDEAFNKMDEERIQTSLRLIKNMNFQLIAAVPDEKLASMAKEVSTIVIVNRVGYECFTDMIEYTEREIGEGPTEQGDEKFLSVQHSLLTAEEV